MLISFVFRLILLLALRCFIPFPHFILAGVSTGDFNRQLLSHMMQMNQILGDVKDLLRQQVLVEVLHNVISPIKLLPFALFCDSTPFVLVVIFSMCMLFLESVQVLKSVGI